MNNYDVYLEAIDNIEEIEKVVITEPRYRRCCTLTLELIKTVLQNLKNFKNKKI